MTDDDLDIIGNEVYPLPVMVYGQPEAEATETLRQRLDELEVSFVEVNVDENEQAAKYVREVNQGQLRTPTVVFGDEEYMLTDPSRDELDRVLRLAGYDV